MEDYNTLNLEIPNVLFLSGIDIKEYISIEDKANEKFMHQEELDNLKECPMYTKNNINFLSNEKWPKKTNLHCWNCDFTFDGDPIFVPIYIKECSTGGLEFGVRGNMCTFNCAMSIILNITYPNSSERWKYINNLKILYFIKNGIHISDIKPAPNKYNLQKYGGPWSNSIFLEELQKLNICNKGLTNNLSNAIFEREKIISVVKNIIDTNKKTIRDIDDNEDDCVIYRGNRISLGKKNIWALHKTSLGETALGEISLGETALGKTALGETSLGETSLGETSLGETALGEMALGEMALGEMALGEMALGEMALGESNLAKSKSILEDDNFDFNQFLLDEIFK